MTVVVAELCTSAVVTVPIPTPANRLFDVLSNHPRNLFAASFSMFSDNSLNPIRNAPSPANSLKKDST